MTSLLFALGLGVLVAVPFLQAWRIRREPLDGALRHKCCGTAFESYWDMVECCYDVMGIMAVSRAIANISEGRPHDAYRGQTRS